jgi:hypothetical protein
MFQAIRPSGSIWLDLPTQSHDVGVRSWQSHSCWKQVFLRSRRLLAAQTTTRADQTLRVGGLCNDIKQQTLLTSKTSQTHANKHLALSSLQSPSSRSPSWAGLRLTLNSKSPSPIPLRSTRFFDAVAVSCNPCHAHSAQAPLITPCAPSASPTPASYPRELCAPNEASRYFFLNAIVPSFAPGWQRLKGTVSTSRHVPG